MIHKVDNVGIIIIFFFFFLKFPTYISYLLLVHACYPKMSSVLFCSNITIYWAFPVEIAHCLLYNIDIVSYNEMC